MCINKDVVYLGKLTDHLKSTVVYITYRYIVAIWFCVLTLKSVPIWKMSII